MGGVNVPIGHGICQGDVIVEVGVVVLSPFLQEAKMPPKPLIFWVMKPRVKLSAAISQPTGVNPGLQYLSSLRDWLVVGVGCWLLAFWFVD